MNIDVTEGCPNENFGVVGGWGVAVDGDALENEKRGTLGFKF